VEPAHRREVATPTGSRRSRELTGGRDNAGETQERRIRRLIQGEYRRAEGDAKLMEDALGVVFTSTNERVRHRNTPKTDLATGKVMGGAAKSNELLLRLTGCGTTVRENSVSVPSLEGQANTTGAVVRASARTKLNAHLEPR
jgi:hypothetical protein